MMRAMSKLKVAILTTAVEYGGCDKVVLSLIENINRTIFDIVSVLFTRITPYDHQLLQELRAIKTDPHIIHVNNYMLRYVNPIVNILDLYKLLRHRNIDLIHTHGYRADALGYLLARLKGLPIIATVHGHITYNWTLRMYTKLDCALLRRFDRVIAVSEGIKAELIAHSVEEERMTVIPNGVTVSESDESFQRKRMAIRQLCGIHDEFTLGYIGRLSPEKGVKYLVKAASFLKRMQVPIKVLLIGEGSEREELERLVKDCDLDDTVIFTGFRKQIDQWISGLDVFVLPSLTEGTPLSLLEVMACGVPVVASAVGGVPQIVVSGYNGLLVAPGNAEAIRDAVITLYKQEALRELVKTNAKLTIRARYNLKDWVSSIEKVYRGVAAAQGDTQARYGRCAL